MRARGRYDVNFTLFLSLSFRVVLHSSCKILIHCYVIGHRPVISCEILGYKFQVTSGFFIWITWCCCDVVLTFARLVLIAFIRNLSHVKYRDPLQSWIEVFQLNYNIRDIYISIIMISLKSFHLTLRFEYLILKHVSSNDCLIQVCVIRWLTMAARKSGARVVSIVALILWRSACSVSINALITAILIRHYSAKITSTFQLCKG